MAITYEFGHGTRVIPVDGSPHPDGLPIPGWETSRGAAGWHNTLSGRRGRLQRSNMVRPRGNFHSDAMHVVERYSLTDADHIQYEAPSKIPRCSRGPGR